MDQARAEVNGEVVDLVRIPVALDCREAYLPTMAKTVEVEPLLHHNQELAELELAVATTPGLEMGLTVMDHQTEVVVLEAVVVIIIRVLTSRMMTTA
jgi:hypothetical protein